MVALRLVKLALVELKIEAKREVAVALVALRIEVKKVVEVPLAATRAVEKRLVEVALVLVEFEVERFWIVDEPVTIRLLRVVRPEAVSVVNDPAPEADTTQLPVMAKQPLVRLIPPVE